jgi:hypothetical protein
MTFKSKNRKYIIELPIALKELRDKIQEFIDVVSENPFVTVRMYTPERSIRPCGNDDYNDYSEYLNKSICNDDSSGDTYYLYSKYNFDSKPTTLVYYDTLIIQLDNTWYSIKECETDKNYLKIASESSVDVSVRTITYGNTTAIIKTPIVQINVDKVDSDRAANMLIFAILKSLSDEKVFYLETTKGA